MSILTLSISISSISHLRNTQLQREYWVLYIGAHWEKP